MKHRGMGKIVRKYNSAAMFQRSQAAKAAAGVECRECQCTVYHRNGVLPERCERCGAEVVVPAHENGKPAQD